MSGFHKISHKGSEIIYVDYRGQSESEMLDTAQELKNWLLSHEEFHLRLVNISDAFATPKFTSFIRELGKETKHIPVKAAVVGITGAKKVLLMGYNRLLGGAMRPFETEEEAKEYLVSV
ncbi:MAG: hypothetical protein JXR03_04030 [Cyclobacteriaceae bacterium]